MKRRRKPVLPLRTWRRPDKISVLLPDDALLMERPADDDVLLWL
jgi:hypothetical protein